LFPSARAGILPAIIRARGGAILEGLTVIVYLSGRFCPLAEAAVPLTDRGLLFGDGIYEVYRVYGGRPFRMKEHLMRLRRSAEAIRLELPELDWEGLHRELAARNRLEAADATVYIQVTRGAPEGRGHAFPPPQTPPTVFVIPRPLRPLRAELWTEGARVITRPDLRWGRCDVKSVNLLPNVLANQDAAEAGAWETVLVRDGTVTEGSHTNVFAVIGGRVQTHPEGPRILSGITREVALELARDQGLDVRETAIGLGELGRAEEVFLTGTTAEIMPVVQVDGAPVASGRPGPVALRLQEAFRRAVAGG
jgi:D-alanine transaminase